MDINIVQPVIIILILLATSAFFSASETSFTSVNQIRLRNQSAKGDKRAERTLRLSNRYDSLLSTILIGNNIANIGMSSVATLLFVQLSPEYGPTLATIVITIVVLIFGEITPKTVANQKSESVAKAVTPVISFLMTLFTPVLWVLDKWNDLLANVLNFEEEETVSEEELIALVRQAGEEGNLEESERELVKAAILFDDTDILQASVPRVDIVGVDISASDREIEEMFLEYPYSRLIVYRDNFDHIEGILHAKDFYRYLIEKERSNIKQPLESLLSEVVYVPDFINLAELLEIMQNERHHMAVLTNEQGGTKGIITLEDVIEELIGDVWDEHDEIKETIIQLEPDETYRVSGNVNMNDFLNYFNLEVPADIDINATTVGGWVVEVLGEIPEEGDEFSVRYLKVTVSEMEKNRVREVQVDYIK